MEGAVTLFQCEASCGRWRCDFKHL